ncbi:MAG: hypothetical protein WCO56_10270 [Verrucomicrobiota bacterium]
MSPGVHSATLAESVCSAAIGMPHDDYFVWLIAVLVVTICMFAMFSAYLLGRYFRERSHSRWAPYSGGALAPRAPLFYAFPAEMAWNWMVVKCPNPMILQEALHLHKAAPSSMPEAMTEVTSRKLFISQPVNGWVMVFGPGLPEVHEDVDRTYRFLRALSQRVGHLQYFSVNRLAGQHAWAMLDSGQVVRAYAWAEATLWNQGEITKAEHALRLICLPYGETTATSNPKAADSLATNAERVPLLAARWGIDPGVIFAHMGAQRRGIVGELPQSQLI